MANYLKLMEVAHRLGISERTARRYVTRGELPSVYVGNSYRVKEEDLEEYLRQAEVTPGPKARTPPETKEAALARTLLETMEAQAAQWEHLVFSNAQFSPIYSAANTAMVVRELVHQRAEQLEEDYRNIRPVLSEAEREAFGPVMDRLVEAYYYVGGRAKEILEVERERAEKRGEEEAVAELRQQIDEFESSKLWLHQRDA